MMHATTSILRVTGLKDRLQAEGRRNALLLKANAAVMLFLIAWVGLVRLPIPLVLGVVVVALYLQVLAFRIRTQPQPVEETDYSEEASDKVATDVQRRVARSRAAQLEGPIGLHQRWYMELRLRQELARCRRYGLSMALIVVKLNVAKDKDDDTSDSGWLTEAAHAADLTARSLRNVDMAAELSPTEFSLSLVHCNENGAEAAMQRLSRELHGFDIEMGYAVYPKDDVSPTELIERARSRLEHVVTATPVADAA